MFKVQFTQRRDDGMNYIIGEKEFGKGTTKEAIDDFIKNTMNVYRDTMKGWIGCYIMEQKDDFWTIPVNPKTLVNELV